MIIGFAFTYFGIQIPNEIAFNVSLAIFYASFLFSLVFAIMRLFRKDYLKGTLQILGTIIIGGFSYLFLNVRWLLLFVVFMPLQVFL